VEIVQSRGRIKRAVAVLEGATRFDFIEHDEAEQVIEILKGETDEQEERRELVWSLRVIR
jgi:hypothetical protein